MPLHKFSDTELRQYCKEAIEALELWLRRIIDMALTHEFGEDYVNAKYPEDDQSIIKKATRESLEKRACSSPERYPRQIDAAFLIEEIDIICNPKLYRRCFEGYFEASYPKGNETLRFFLNKIVAPRNHLSHSNPISVRQAEQTICYSHDVIDAIKTHLKELNMEKEYDAPTIIKISDSNGSVFYEPQIRRNSTGRGLIEVKEDKSTWLRVGDTISIEAEVDPSYTASRYDILWNCSNSVPVQQNDSGNRITITFSEEHVREDFAIYCSVISHKSWHRCGDVDDCVALIYKILPPI